MLNLIFRLDGLPVTEDLLERSDMLDAPAARPAVRVAAVGDVHLGADLAGYLRPRLEPLPGQADVLLLAGDLTCYGTAVRNVALPVLRRPYAVYGVAAGARVSDT